MTKIEMKSSCSMWPLPVFLAFMLVLGVAPATAQISIEPGVKIGGNLATWQGADVPSSGTGIEVNVKRRTGLLVGVFTLVDFDGPFALQPELLYVQKGMKMDGRITASGETMDFLETRKVDYLELSVLAKSQIPGTGPAAPTLFAGPALGFKINESIKDEAVGETKTLDTDYVKGTDVGLVIGGGVDIGLATGTLTVDLRYALGVSNILSAGGDVKNNGIMLTTGLHF